MPRSRDPNRYSKFYRDISLLMDAGETDIRLKMTGKQAIHYRNNFYAYVNAWKHQADTILNRKAIPHDIRRAQAETALKWEALLGKYLCIILPSINITELRDAPEVTLRFLHRDYDPRTPDIDYQLEQLIDKTNALARVAAKYKALNISDINPAAPIPTESNAIRGDNSPLKHLFETIKPVEEGPETKSEGQEHPTGNETSSKPLPAGPTTFIDTLPKATTDNNSQITPDNPAASTDKPSYRAEALEYMDKLGKREKRATSRDKRLFKQ